MSVALLALVVLVRDYVPDSGDAKFHSLPTATGIVSRVEERQADGGALFYTVEIASDEKPVRDRALVVRILLPQEGPCDFMHTHYPRDPVKVWSRKVDCPARLTWNNTEVGSSKMISTVPLMGISAAGATEGSALGVAMTCPVICRLGFDSARKALYADCDIGLAPECPKAVVRLLGFPFAAEDGFRGAYERYMALQPKAFGVRMKDHGTWLCMTKAGDIPDWQDFGFKFMQHEWDVPGDDARGMYTFRYTSPSTWKISIPTNRPLDLASAIAVAEEQAAKGRPMAQAWKECRFLDENGNPACVFFDKFWLRGVSWNLNAEPSIPAKMTPFVAMGNSKEALDRRYPEDFPKGLDGEFIDDACGYGTVSFDHDRSHFPHMKDAPLCYSHASGRVGICNVFSNRAYIRDLAREMRMRGRYMMVNGAAYRYHFLAPYADIPALETTSVGDKGEYLQRKDTEMLEFRMLAGRKPYCMFQNANFNLLTYEMSERYMQRLLAYGILPSFFSPIDCGSTRFFSVPKWREGVRPLFKKYFKTLKAVSEAGWEPVSRTLRSARPDDVTVEQFGTLGSSKGCYLTVHNPSGKPAETTLLPVHGFPAAAEYADVVGGSRVVVGEPITIPPYATWVLSFPDAVNTVKDN